MAPPEHPDPSDFADASAAPVGGVARLTLPAIFSDAMVLQRHLPAHVWGWTSPGETVTVTFADQRHQAIADTDGRWQITLTAMKASDRGETLEVRSRSDSIVIRDVLVGEVWLASGQSNMFRSMSRFDDATMEADIEAANDEHLRLFSVAKRSSSQVQRDVEGQWALASPDVVRDFSATGYYFGRKLRQALDVPVAVIASAWGSTRAEAWTPMAALQAEPRLRPLLEHWNRCVAENPEQLEERHHPSNLYNAMIEPLRPLTFRGVIWYQGESNFDRGSQYRTLFPLLIQSWRQQWGRNFPFYFVQLAPFAYHQRPNVDAALLPELWEAQLMTMRMLPDTGMVVSTDIGDLWDIHPANKRYVGDRLARWALARTYHHDIVPSGPIYTHHAIDGDTIRIHFDHVADGLASRDGQPLTHFTVADADGRFHPASATIDGHILRVRSEAVNHPVAVRFAWTEMAEPNLINTAGLPASPFRTDSLPLLSRDRHD